MTYAKVENGAVAEYPVYAGDIIRRFPDTSFPIPFEAPDGYEEVLQEPPPSVNHLSNLREGTPEFVDGILVQSWIVEPATPEEIQDRTERKSAEVREQRNSLLLESDWTQLPDSGINKEPWIEYRQALRDVTVQPGFPWEIGWPEKP